MKRELSIKDELRAIQSGELTCSPEKLAACAAYCRKRLDMLRRSLESQSVPAAYIEQVQANIHSFSDFLGWAEAQKPTRVFQPIVLSRRSLNRVVYAQAWL